nr:hypothetical protein [Vibrio lentus]
MNNRQEHEFRNPYRDGILVNLVFNIKTKPAAKLAFLMAKTQRPIENGIHLKTLQDERR